MVQPCDRVFFGRAFAFKDAAAPARIESHDRYHPGRAWFLACIFTQMSFLMKNIACIDMEGVLIPELWPHIAEAAGISDLAITTREEPDYARLVNRRIELLRKNSLRLIDVQALIERVDPLPGAYRFLTELRQDFHVVLVSDAFQEMILPLWEKLDQPGGVKSEVQRFWQQARAARRVWPARFRYRPREEFESRGSCEAGH